jgi:hypothetical protein
LDIVARSLQALGSAADREIADRYASLPQCTPVPKTARIRPVQESQRRTTGGSGRGGRGRFCQGYAGSQAQTHRKVTCSGEGEEKLSHRDCTPRPLL